LRKIGLSLKKGNLLKIIPLSQRLKVSKVLLNLIIQVAILECQKEIMAQLLHGFIVYLTQSTIKP